MSDLDLVGRLQAAETEQENTRLIAALAEKERELTTVRNTALINLSVARDRGVALDTARAEIARLGEALSKIADPLLLAISGIGTERALRTIAAMRDVARAALSDSPAPAGDNDADLPTAEDVRGILGLTRDDLLTLLIEECSEVIKATEQ